MFEMLGVAFVGKCLTAMLQFNEWFFYTGDGDLLHRLLEFAIRVLLLLMVAGAVGGIYNARANFIFGLPLLRTACAAVLLGFIWFVYEAVVAGDTSARHILGWQGLLILLGTLIVGSVFRSGVLPLLMLGLGFMFLPYTVYQQARSTSDHVAIVPLYLFIMDNEKAGGLSSLIYQAYGTRKMTQSDIDRIQNEDMARLVKNATQYKSPDDLASQLVFLASGNPVAKEFRLMATGLPFLIPLGEPMATATNVVRTSLPIMSLTFLAMGVVTLLGCLFALFFEVDGRITDRREQEKRDADREKVQESSSAASAPLADTTPADSESTPI